MSTDAPNTDASADTGHDAAASAATTPAATTPAAATPKPTPPPSPSIPPPSPSFTVPTYSLPEPASQDWLTRTRTWIEEHPALAVTAAVGVGLTLGRVLSGAFKAPPPPSLTERVEARARELGDEIAKRGTTAAEKGRVMAAKGSAAASDAAPFQAMMLSPITNTGPSASTALGQSPITAANLRRRFIRQ
ncbi:MAG: hypothetical protein AAGN64_15350, partial [Bacteroidota bacterium]